MLTWLSIIIIIIGTPPRDTLAHPGTAPGLTSQVQFYLQVSPTSDPTEPRQQLTPLWSPSLCSVLILRQRGRLGLLVRLFVCCAVPGTYWRRTIVCRGWQSTRQRVTASLVYRHTSECWCSLRHVRLTTHLKYWTVSYDNRHNILPITVTPSLCPLSPSCYYLLP
jgi:hypothetical protein